MSSKNRLLDIYSKDAVNRDMATSLKGTSHFTLNIADPIVIYDDEVAFVSVRHAEIPVTFYQIGPHYGNHIIYFTVLRPNAAWSGQQYITVPAGTYTADEYCLKVEALLKLNGMMIEWAGVTGDGDANYVDFSFDQNTLHFIISVNFGTIRVKFQFPLMVEAGLVLGFDSTAESGEVTDTNDLVGQYAGNVIPLPMVWIRSNLNRRTTYSSRSNGYSNVLDRFPVEVHGTVIQYSNTDAINRSVLRQNVINSLELMVTDDRGKVIDLNGADWSVGILVEIEKKQ
jgi:hypothetical protein